jgi:RimJ/RimL family protein N-acetyltransferase
MSSDASIVSPPGMKRELPILHTPRFVVAPLKPAEVRDLVQVLLQDDRLAAQLPWMREKTLDGALREAFLLEMQCAAGTVEVWGIVERARTMLVGAALARHALSGIDIEVLCASQLWDQGVADEVFGPVAEWLEGAIDIRIGLPQ